MRSRELGQILGGAVVTAPPPSRRIPWRMGLVYVLYTLLAFVAFLVWLFPLDCLQSWLLDEAGRRAGATITVEDREWLFPLGVRWRGIRVEPHERPEHAVTFDALQVRVAVLPLIGGRIEADLTWEAYGGKVRGSWVLEREGGGTRSSLDQFGQGFDLSRLAGLPGGAWRGVMQLNVNGRWLNEAWWLGEGTGSLDVSQLKVDGLAISGFPVNGIEFDSVAGQFALNGGTITLHRITAKGPLGTLSGDGTVLVRAPWTESVINVTLRVEPSAEALTRVPLLALAGGRGVVTVRLNGRLVKPGVTVNGAPVA